MELTLYETVVAKSALKTLRSKKMAASKSE